VATPLGKDSVKIRISSGLLGDRKTLQFGRPEGKKKGLDEVLSFRVGTK
jgi:hypothetical protein